MDRLGHDEHHVHSEVRRSWSYDELELGKVQHNRDLDPAKLLIAAESFERSDS